MAVGNTVRDWVPLPIQPLTEGLDESKDTLLEVLGSLLFGHFDTLSSLSYSFPSLFGTRYDLISSNVLIYSPVNYTAMIFYLTE